MDAGRASAGVGLGDADAECTCLDGDGDVARLAKDIAIDLCQGGFLESQLGLGPLHLLDGRIRGQGTLLRFAGDRLVNHIPEKIRPADQPAGGVDDFEVLQTVVE
mgnify:CR=1 FL=1